MLYTNVTFWIRFPYRFDFLIDFEFLPGFLIYLNLQAHTRYFCPFVSESKMWWHCVRCCNRVLISLYGYVFLTWAPSQTESTIFGRLTLEFGTLADVTTQRSITPTWTMELVLRHELWVWAGELWLHRMRALTVKASNSWVLHSHVAEWCTMSSTMYTQ